MIVVANIKEHIEKQTIQIIREGINHTLNCIDLHCSFSDTDVRKIMTHMKSVHGLIKKNAKYTVIQFGLQQQLIHTNTQEVRSGRASGPLRTTTSQSRFQPYVPSRSPSRSRTDIMTQLPMGILTPENSRSVQTTPAITRPSSPILDEDILTTTGTSDLLSSNLLRQFSLRIHQVHKTLHCFTCLVAILPAHAQSHLRAHEIVITATENIKLLQVCTENQVLMSMDNMESPRPDNAPVEGLAIHDEGYSCSLCDYCSIAIKSFDNHWYTNHTEDKAPAHTS